MPLRKVVRTAEPNIWSRRSTDLRTRAATVSSRRKISGLYMFMARWLTPQKLALVISEVTAAIFQYHPVVPSRILREASAELETQRFATCTCQMQNGRRLLELTFERVKSGTAVSRHFVYPKIKKNRNTPTPHNLGRSSVLNWQEQQPGFGCTLSTETPCRRVSLLLHPAHQKLRVTLTQSHLLTNPLC